MNWGLKFLFILLLVATLISAYFVYERSYVSSDFSIYETYESLE